MRHEKLWPTGAVALVVTAMLGATPAHAEPPAPAAGAVPVSAGDLDPSFGTGGSVLSDVGGGAVDTLVQPDGTIITVASAPLRAGGPTAFTVTRHLADGSPDPSFGTGGTVRTDVTGTGGASTVSAVARQSDGRLVVVGTAWPRTADSRFAVVRYLPDGSLDPSFGAGGIVLTQIPFSVAGSRSYATAVAVGGDGRIVVAGTTSARAETDWVPTFAWTVVRYLPDGALDASLGGTGIAHPPVGGRNDARSVLLQPDGKIVVAGDSGTNHYRLYLLTADFTLARLLPNGSRDTTFGDNGVVRTSFPNRHSSIARVLRQPDGKLVAVGWSGGLIYSTPVHRVALARYRANGAPDSGFGTGGLVETDVRADGAADRGATAALRADGRIVVAGGSSSATTAGHTDIFVGRYLSTGAPDPAFGTGGVAVTDADPSAAVEHAAAVALYPDGRVLAAGTSVATGSRTVLVRYLP
ncbi:MAG TPA: hypothetical protein VNV66_06480 [Pilimelia sp.]|nr:hypothetical protein [Pilimelia sp.]